jgi:hypothetical protein
MMDIEVIRRICLARHLYELGLGSIKSANDLYLFSGVNLLQDAVEAFLVGVADFVGATLDERTNFDKYFVLINEKINPKELPFKNKLLRLNRIRVDSKHHGIQPARDECKRLAEAVREFFDEVSNSVLNISFAAVSTIDLLKEGETKETLLNAKSALDKGDFKECAISCRKAIYLELEQPYDISDFKEEPVPNALRMAFSRAPSFVKNKQYIDEYVKDPTDYIVYDHTHLDQELLKYGVDNTAFWNVWRLTPEVYRTKDKEWIIKDDFAKLEPDVLKDNIEYVFNTTADIIITIHAKKGSIKTSSDRRYYLELKQEEVPIYEKADVTSRIVATTPSGLTKLNCDYQIIGLKGDGLYWHISELALWGFIHNDYVK